MKKILSAIAVIITAGIVNAAAFDWAAYVEDYDSEDAMAGLVGRIFVSTGSDYISSLSTKLAAGDYSVWTSDGMVEKTTGTNGKIVVSDYSGSYTAGTYDFFAVFLDKASTETATSFYVTATKSAELVDGYDTVVNLGNQTLQSSNWKSISTSSTPEPTSGLLMVLGLAGLALKRKRA